MEEVAIFFDDVCAEGIELTGELIIGKIKGMGDQGAITGPHITVGVSIE